MPALFTSFRSMKRRGPGKFLKRENFLFLPPALPEKAAAQDAAKTGTKI
jgi:hypothetical protein